MLRLEEDIREIRGQQAELVEIVGTMARDFSRFTVWAAGGIRELLRASGIPYDSYAAGTTTYRHRVRHRTDGAGPSGGSDHEDQPDP